MCGLSKVMKEKKKYCMALNIGSCLGKHAHEESTFYIHRSTISVQNELRLEVYVSENKQICV